MALLRTIATYGRVRSGSHSPNTDFASTKVPCGLADAYLAMTGSEMQDSHTACGDCRGMSRVLTELQQCRQRCESL